MAKKKIANVELAEEKLSTLGCLLKRKQALLEKREDRIYKVEKAFANDLSSIEQEIRRQMTAINQWAARNRENLLPKKKKTIELVTGKLTWRRNKGRLQITDEEAVINYLLGITKHPELIRRRFSINQSLLLQHPQLIEEMEGITLIPPKESLYIKVHNWDKSLKVENE